MNTCCQDTCQARQQELDSLLDQVRRADTSACTTSYLTECLKKIRELQSLAADFISIKENEAVAIEDRYGLAMNDNCFGRIEQLFEELNIPFHVGNLQPRILGYQTCLNLIETEFNYRLKSLTGLLTAQD